MSDNIINPMTEVRRELNLRIVNGLQGQQMHQVTSPLYFLDQHFTVRHLNKALIWLIENNFVGVAFIAWYQGPCGGSDLQMHRILLSVVENDVLKPIIGGKNFRL